MEKKSKYKWSIIIGFIVALIYIIVPTDIMPDLLPGVGWIDDIVAILLAVANAIRLGSKIKKSK